MNLDESQFSDIDDAERGREIRFIAYSHDNRPAWIGAHRPRTCLDKLQAMADWARTHYAFYLNFVGTYMEPQKAVLDIGCGAGQNTAMLARYSVSALGIDEDEKAIEFALRHNAEKSIFAVSQFPAKDRKPEALFDYIFCIEVIEHVPYEKQWEFLDAALSLLKPEGLLFLTTPNEKEAAPPHIGIWTPERFGQITDRYCKNIKRQSYFSNTEPQLGFRGRESSHHALVMYK